MKLALLPVSNEGKVVNNREMNWYFQAFLLIATAGSTRLYSYGHSVRAKCIERGSARRLYQRGQAVPAYGAEEESGVGGAFAMKHREALLTNKTAHVSPALQCRLGVIGAIIRKVIGKPALHAGTQLNPGAHNSASLLQAVAGAKPGQGDDSCPQNLGPHMDRCLLGDVVGPAGKLHFRMLQLIAMVNAFKGPLCSMLLTQRSISALNCGNLTTRALSETSLEVHKDQRPLTSALQPSAARKTLLRWREAVKSGLGWRDKRDTKRRRRGKKAGNSPLSSRLQAVVEVWPGSDGLRARGDGPRTVLLLLALRSLDWMWG
ncbi:hypothetical protein SKAU_G00403170 [Synaphobranchus kaupii]|uniref:Uncharacterized protein n=1 Tax=Synaphobranchus kaupii TaxID=118154 RepID=A0A9Q1IAK0_SYNKA|nr:hypothetical protein SKAU_G00403170 [Synaphobranchus kaupii]